MGHSMQTQARPYDLLRVGRQAQGAQASLPAIRSHLNKKQRMLVLSDSEDEEPVVQKAGVQSMPEHAEDEEYHSCEGENM